METPAGWSWAPMADAELPSFHGIIGRSAAMQALFRRIERVAPIDVPVLIQGESGTGKELVASAIQRLSRRRDRPFEIVNCGAISARAALRASSSGTSAARSPAPSAGRSGLLAVAARRHAVPRRGRASCPSRPRRCCSASCSTARCRRLGATETIRVDVRAHLGHPPEPQRRGRPRGLPG